MMLATYHTGKQRCFLCACLFVVTARSEVCAAPKLTKKAQQKLESAQIEKIMFTRPTTDQQELAFRQMWRQCIELAIAANFSAIPHPQQPPEVKQTLLGVELSNHGPYALRIKQSPSMKGFVNLVKRSRKNAADDPWIAEAGKSVRLGADQDVEFQSIPFENRSTVFSVSHGPLFCVQAKPNDPMLEPIVIWMHYAIGTGARGEVIYYRYYVSSKGFPDGTFQ